MTKTRLEILTERKKQLDAQIQALKAKENEQQRKNDTRKKIIIGGVILKMVKSGELTEERLRAMLDKNLEVERDRLLFELSAKPKETTSGSDSKG